MNPDQELLGPMAATATLDEVAEAVQPRFFASSVKITVDSKDMPKPEIKVYAGTMPEEMQAALDLAVDTLNAARRKLGQLQFQPLYPGA